MDSFYYSEWELCGGAVTVSLPKYLPWQAMYFLQRSTHFSKTCCRPLISSKFLASKPPFHGWKNPEIAWGEIWIEFCVRLGRSGSVGPHYNIRHTVQISPHAISGLLQPWKGSSKAINFEVINGLQHVFGKWMERFKKCSAAKGGTSKKRPSSHLHEVPTRSNKVSPRTFQTSVVFICLFSCVNLPVKFGVTLTEEQRFRLFENKVQRRIFEPKREEVTGLRGGAS
jgi:hypothetical protein